MGRERRELRTRRDWDETRTRQGVTRTSSFVSTQTLFVHIRIMRSLSLHARRTARENQTTSSLGDLGSEFIFPVPWHVVISGFHCIVLVLPGVPLYPKQPHFISLFCFVTFFAACFTISGISSTV